MIMYFLAGFCPQKSTKGEVTHCQTCNGKISPTPKVPSLPGSGIHGGCWRSRAVTPGLTHPRVPSLPRAPPPSLSRPY